MPIRCYPRPSLYDVLLALRVNSKWVGEDLEFYSKRYESWINQAYEGKLVGPEQHVIALSVFHKYYFDHFLWGTVIDNGLFKDDQWNYLFHNDGSSKELEFLLKVKSILEPVTNGDDEEFSRSPGTSFAESVINEDSFESAECAELIRELWDKGAEENKKRKMNE